MVGAWVTEFWVQVLSSFTSFITNKRSNGQTDKWTGPNQYAPLNFFEVTMHKCRNCGLNKLSLWPSYHLTFKCDLDPLPTQTNVSNGPTTPQEQLCKLFWNPCINVEVMALTSSIYDYFIICPSSVTLTFNLPEQMFQIATTTQEEQLCQNYFEIHA